jgi:hypothetical protein
MNLKKHFVLSSLRMQCFPSQSEEQGGVLACEYNYMQKMELWLHLGVSSESQKYTYLIPDQSCTTGTFNLSHIVENVTALSPAPSAAAYSPLGAPLFFQSCAAYQQLARHQQL